MIEVIARTNVHWWIFGASFLAVGLWETYRPFRALVVNDTRRWAGHLVLAVLAQAIVFIMPLSAAVVAAGVRGRSFGLLASPAIPFALQCGAAFLLLDCTRWLQHFCYHHFSWLWRIHRVHHSDAHFDLTTTLRFHPFEALFTQVWYLGAVALIAPPPAIAAGIELLMLAQNFFSHANVRVGGRVDGFLRRIIITPAMHRVHHSIERDEQDSNYGVLLPWWDYCFRTYRAEAAAGVENERFGLRGVEPEQSTSVPHLLVLPFSPLDLEQTPAPPPAKHAATV